MESAGAYEARGTLCEHYERCCGRVLVGGCACCGDGSRCVVRSGSAPELEGRLGSGWPLVRIWIPGKQEFVSAEPRVNIQGTE